MMSTPTNGTGSSSSSHSGGGGGGHTSATSNSIHNSSPTYPSNISSTMLPSVASRIKKNLNRTKEKILQGIGKTDRTSDENFDLYVENFERQHAQASKLAKELNKYVNNLREMHKSSKSFYDTLRETFEPNWPGSDAFNDQVQLAEQKWSDYLVKLNNDVQSPLAAYLNEFPELKKKIEKRGNRLLDYDNARHTLEGVQTKTLKKSSTSSNSGNSNSNGQSHDHLTKMTKLRIDLEDKQHVYEEINQTLCLSLPVLYENRIKFYASLFQTFFHTETIFNSDLLEVKSKLDEICENLSVRSLQEVVAPETAKTVGKKLERAGSSLADYSSRDAGEGAVNGRHSSNGSSSASSAGRANSMYVKPSHLSTRSAGDSPPTSNNSLSDAPASAGVGHSSSNGLVSSSSASGSGNTNSEDSANEQLKGAAAAARRSSVGTSAKINPAFMHQGGAKHDSNLKSEFVPDSRHINENIIIVPAKNGHSSPEPSTDSSTTTCSGVANNNNNNKSSSSFHNSSPNEITLSSDYSSNGHGHAVKSSLNRVCYRVKATYGYEGKELDELTFGKDDVINVVEGTESEKEDLDEGWLIGIHESSSRRGLFPENFTKRI